MKAEDVRPKVTIDAPCFATEPDLEGPSIDIAEMISELKESSRDEKIFGPIVWEQ